ncbi:hypothetical protein F0U59_26820 [Archangium gephyra]|nr:hypothetical protein F0U59_26820 [Archangium gephyra]
MPAKFQQLCAMYGGHRPNPDMPSRCIICMAQLEVATGAPTGVAAPAPEGASADTRRVVPPCGMCARDLVWDAEAEDGMGGYVCSGCWKFPTECRCTVAHSEAPRGSEDARNE